MFKRFTLRNLQRTCERDGMPTPFCHYLQQSRLRPAAQTPISEARLVVFDTETTGLSLQRDRLLSIGAVVVQHGEIKLGDTFELLVNNELRPNQTSSIPVHGLRPSETKQGYDELSAILAFLEYMQADVIVAHHAVFDVGMVEQVLQRHLHPKSFLFNRQLDTATIARKYEHSQNRSGIPSQKQYGLDDLCERYHVSREDRHTAWGDALITAKLLLKFIHLFEQKGKTRLSAFS